MMIDSEKLINHFDDEIRQTHAEREIACLDTLKRVVALNALLTPDKIDTWGIEDRLYDICREYIRRYDKTDDTIDRLHIAINEVKLIEKDGE